MMSIIHQVVSKSYDDLRKLVETYRFAFLRFSSFLSLLSALLTILLSSLHASDDSERKFKLNAYFKRTQVELIRLLVLLKVRVSISCRRRCFVTIGSQWAENIPQIQNSNDLVQQLTTQSENFRVTGDHLFFLTRELFDPQGYLLSRLRGEVETDSMM